MSRLRLLYLDVPFLRESGGDKNRSRFLFEALRAEHTTDLVLIQPQGAKGRPDSNRCEPLALLPAQRPPFPRSASIPSFSRDSHAQFAGLVQAGAYDAVFCRFCTGWELCARAARQSPKLSVVVDVDMLSSRLVALSWAASPSLRRRWFLFETWRLRWFEKRLFRAPWLFLFTNPTELAEARDRLAPRDRMGEFALAPNPMPRVTRIQRIQRRPVVLFFGSMDSAANRDGFAFLADQIVPQLEPDLRRHGVVIDVVGKNPPDSFRARLGGPAADCIRIIGGVESIEQAIAESLFVLLPLRIASGTRTRILEAAAQARAVITTTLGVEGLDLGDTVLVGDTAQALVEHTQHLLDHREEADRLGRRVQERALALYAPDKVAKDLTRAIEGFVSRGRGEQS